MSNSTAWKDNIEHVVVLMMENRSFDMMLGDFSKINPDCDGIDYGHPASNSYTDDQGSTTTLTQQPETSGFFELPSNPAFDPLHDFVDVQAQLGGDLGNPNTSGFLQDAYNGYKDTEFKAPLDLATLLQRIMNYFSFGTTNAADTLPGLQGLARMFRVCDKWFCSLPGPTWPNRFFAMLGSCYGRVLMPSSIKDVWLALKILSTIKPKDSIFSVLKEKGVSHGVYSDATIPIALMSSGVYLYSWMDTFFEDAKAGRLPSFSWLEPNYSYNYRKGKGNSQHPPEDVRKGDRLIANVYNTLRSSSQWEKTLLVVLYDEHGGLHDHVTPYKTIAPDSYQADVNFDFTLLGPRIPAVLASPWIEAGMDHQVYDHTSLLAFVCDKFGLDKGKLGQRVTNSKHFGMEEIWCDQPRADTTDVPVVADVPTAADAMPRESKLDGLMRKVVMEMEARFRSPEIRGHFMNMGALNEFTSMGEDLKGAINLGMHAQLFGEIEADKLAEHVHNIFIEGNVAERLQELTKDSAALALRFNEQDVKERLKEMAQKVSTQIHEQGLPEIGESLLLSSNDAPLGSGT